MCIFHMYRESSVGVEIRRVSSSADQEIPWAYRRRKEQRNYNDVYCRRFKVRSGDSLLPSPPGFSMAECRMELLIVPGLYLCLRARQQSHVAQITLENHSGRCLSGN